MNRASGIENEYRKLYLPGVVIVLLLCLVPIALLLVMSFHRLSLGMPWLSAEFTGLTNWIWLFTNPNQASFQSPGEDVCLLFRQRDFRVAFWPDHRLPPLPEYLGGQFHCHGFYHSHGSDAGHGRHGLEALFHGQFHYRLSVHICFFTSISTG